MRFLPSTLILLAVSILSGCVTVKVWDRDPPRQGDALADAKAREAEYLCYAIRRVNYADDEAYFEIASPDPETVYLHPVGSYYAVIKSVCADCVPLVDELGADAGSYKWHDGAIAGGGAVRRSADDKPTKVLGLVAEEVGKTDRHKHRKERKKKLDVLREQYNRALWHWINQGSLPGS